MEDQTQESPPMTEAEPPQSLEMIRYKEELAEKMNLPSPFMMNTIKKMCHDLAVSGMAPAHFNGNVAAMAIAALRGRELGLDPMESILETFWAMPVMKWNKETRVLENRGTVMGMWSNKMLDICHRRGIKTKFVQETDAICEILFTPPANVDAEPYTAIFRIEEAETAGLINPEKKDSPWWKWRRAMLKSRAMSIGWKAMNGVVGKGANILSKEEMDDMEYDTVAPASNGSPEVQAQQSEPAKAGRKPKDKPITVQSEVVADTPKPAEPAPVPQTEKPVEPAVPAQKYYVISTEAQIPSLDQVQPGPLEQFKIPTMDTTDITVAMKTCDSLTKDKGIEHYILTFANGKATVIHRTKMDPPRKWIIVPEGGLKAATTSEQIEAMAFGHPHAHLNTAEIFAQSEANRVGGVMLVVHKEGNRYELDSKWLPPVKPTPAPEPAPVGVDEQAARDALKLQYDRLVIALPGEVDSKQRKEIIHSYIKAYLQISNMKDFSKDLVLAQECLNACEKDINKDTPAFVQNSESLGKAARDRALPLQSKTSESPDIAIMAKYYHECGWNGLTTSLAEAYRKATCPDVAKFQSILKFSGISSLEEKNAAAYFAVGVSYSKDTAATFGTNVEGPQYADTLTKVRNFFDGEELARIPESKFLSTLAEVMKGTEPEPPGLFG